MAEEDQTLGCNNVILHEIYSIGGAYQPSGYIICDVYGTWKVGLEREFAFEKG